MNRQIEILLLSLGTPGTVCDGKLRFYGSLGRVFTDAPVWLECYPREEDTLLRFSVEIDKRCCTKWEIYCDGFADTLAESPVFSLSEGTLENVEAWILGIDWPGICKQILEDSDEV